MVDHVDFLGVKPTHRDLVSHDQVRELDAFLCLLEGLLVPVQLRQDCTELQPKFGFNLKFLNSVAKALVFDTEVVVPKVINRGLEAQCALFQLTKLLVTHGHVVEELKGDV